MRWRGVAAGLVATLAAALACRPADRGSDATGRGAPGQDAPWTAVYAGGRRTAADSAAEMAMRDSAAARMDSSWRLFLLLHDSAAVAPDSDAPRLLWTAGQLGAADLGFVDPNGPHSEDLARVPGSFAYDQASGGSIYRGWHFLELQRLFPAHELADDAGLAFAQLPLVGECEGDFLCTLGVLVDPLTRFLAAYPRSELAAGVVDTLDTRLAGLFAELVSDDPSFEITGAIGTDTTSAESRAVDRILERYADAIAALPDPLGASARSRFAPTLARWRAARMAEAARPTQGPR